MKTQNKIKIPNTYKTKIGIIANKYFIDLNEIKNLLLLLYNKFKYINFFEIIGVDRNDFISKEIRKLCQQYNFNYLEYIQYNKKWVSYCAEPQITYIIKSKIFKNQKYKGIFSIYKEFVKNCDKIIIFDYEKKEDPHLKIIENYCKKFNKKFVYIMK